MANYSVRSGDTLSAIASRFHTSVSELARLNGIRNVNAINVGQVLRIPDGFSGGANHAAAPSAELGKGAQGAQVKQLQDALVKLGYLSNAEVATGPGIYGPRTEGAVRDFQRDHGVRTTGYYGPLTRTALAKALGGEAPVTPSHPSNPGNGGGTVSAGNVPLWNQGDPRWGGRTLGRSSSIAAAGCAMTSTAMALSKISGRNIDPGTLDRWLDTHGGYVGNGLVWSAAAAMVGRTASKPGWSTRTLDAELAAGRPVVIGVDYKPGSNGGANGTDHWVCITGKHVDGNGRVTYTANDPAGGRVVKFTLSGGQLIADATSSKRYRSTGQMVVFH